MAEHRPPILHGGCRHDSPVKITVPVAVLLRWIPTSADHIIAAKKRLLSIVKTPYVQEKVNIGTGSPGSKIRWFQSSSDEPRFINTVTFDGRDDLPALVMVHGYILGTRTMQFPAVGVGPAGQTLHAKVQKHLILVGSAGFSSESDGKSEWLVRFRATWKGAILNNLWETNFTPQKVVREFGPWGPDYTSARFGSHASGSTLNDDEAKLLADYVYHTLAAKAGDELSLKYIFSFGAFARSPLLHSASRWKLPTTFIYGYQDWMNYQGAQEARKDMKVPCECPRLSSFHSAVFYACRKFLSPDS